MKSEKYRFFKHNKNLLSYLFYTVFVIFLILYVKTIDFTNIDVSNISIKLLFGSIFFGILTRYWSAGIWFFILKKLGAQGLGQKKLELIYVYAKSWLGRYIPGTAPWILGKIYFASKYSISKNKLAVSSVLEASIQIISLVGVSALFLMVDPRLDGLENDYKLLMFGVFVACFIFLIPKLFNFIVAKAYKLIKKQNFSEEHHVKGDLVVGASLLYVVASILNGVSLFFIAKAVYPQLPYNDILFVIGAGNLAGAIGMLAIFVPSGIGVRESIQLILLSLIMPTDVALVVTISTRIIGVVLDLLFWLLALVSLKIYRKMDD